MAFPPFLTHTIPVWSCFRRPYLPLPAKLIQPLALSIFERRNEHWLQVQTAVVTELFRCPATPCSPASLLASSVINAAIGAPFPPFLSLSSLSCSHKTGCFDLNPTLMVRICNLPCSPLLLFVLTGAIRTGHRVQSTTSSPFFHPCPLRVALFPLTPSFTPCVDDHHRTSSWAPRSWSGNRTQPGR